MDHQRAAGLRHFGEALVGNGETLSFVDGLFLCAGNRRHHIGAARLRGLADARPPSQGPLLRLLADVQTRDAALLRRVLLHQLIALLQESGGRRTVSGLGLDPADEAVLVQAVPTVPVLDARQRKAAESLGGLWQQRRLRAVARALDTLGPAVVRVDPALAHLAARLARRLGRCDRSLAAARAGRDAETARTHYLDALGLAADDDTATRGLIMLGRPRRHEDAPLAARLSGDRVLLSWPGADGRCWRAIRLTRGADRSAVVPVAASGQPGTAVDHHPRRGTLVRYAVFPLRDGVPDAPPLVSGPLLIAPGVEDLTVTDGPARLTARWTRPPRTARVTVTLHAAGSSEADADIASAGSVLACHDVGADVDTYTFTGLRPGSYLVRVVCHHPSPEGREVESEAVRASGVVHAWPEALTSLTAEPDPGGGVRFAGQGAAGAEVRLVAWTGPGGAPPEGTGLRTDALPGALPWAAYGTSHPVEPPSAFAGLVVAVAVLGERALVGPAVRVDVPAPVTGLQALRETGGHVRLTFDWPADAGSVEAEWEQRGARDRVRVSRSGFFREGLRLPIGPAGARISVRATSRHEPLAGSPGTDVVDRTVVVVRRAPAVLDLPGEVVVSYRLVTRRRGLTRRATPEAIEVTVTGAGVDDHPAEAGLPGAPNRADLPGHPSSARLPGSRSGAGLPGSPAGTDLPGSPARTGLPHAPTGAGLPVAPTGAALPSSPARTDLPHAPTGAALPGSSPSPAPVTAVDAPPRPAPHPSLPDFVLVSRAGDAATARPRHQEDGDVLVRLTGAELAASARTTLALPAGPLRPPYALRAFLAGEHAGSVRLEEPALSTLVVR
ncbi:hypothetical protein [Streptomyces sp. NPDC093795]|uniref:hypothetical protein n=1 Tax=Streptomyces sp. NPDC093795 TaxID=3366051 RepID=UPI00380F68C1